MVDLSSSLCKRLPEGKTPFSYGFPMVFLWFPMVFPFKPPWYQPLPLPPPRSPSVRAVRAGPRAGDTAATPHGAAACAGNGADARRMD